MRVEPEISIVIPIFNEEAVIPELFQRLQAVMEGVGRRFEIVFVDDGSRDRSFALLEEIYRAHPEMTRVVALSRNFGHQLALTAGLRFCRGRAAVVMDADLQDPPEVIPEFLRYWEEGYQIVYGVRTERQGETLFKKATARWFYKLIRAATSFDIPENAGDFYLLDRKVIDVLNALKERHRFLRGLIAWTGYRRKAVAYTRHPRRAGRTKYSLWKMLTFSWDAMTSFSFAPLRFVSWMGGVFAAGAFVYIIIVIYQKLFTDTTIVGWASLMAVILFLGGVQLLSIGLIGEYIARIGDDVKARPLYAVREVLGE